MNFLNGVGSIIVDSSLLSNWFFILFVFVVSCFISALGNALITRIKIRRDPLLDDDQLTHLNIGVLIVSICFFILVSILLLLNVFINFSKPIVCIFFIIIYSFPFLLIIFPFMVLSSLFLKKIFRSSHKGRGRNVFIGFHNIFVPGWKNSNEDTWKSAIDKTKSSRKLIKIAVSNKAGRDYYALEKITDGRDLAKVFQNKNARTRYNAVLKMQFHDIESYGLVQALVDIINDQKTSDEVKAYAMISLGAEGLAANDLLETFYRFAELKKMNRDQKVRSRTQAIIADLGWRAYSDKVSEEKCTRCNGIGTENLLLSRNDLEYTEQRTCSVCTGTGIEIKYDSGYEKNGVKRHFWFAI